MAELAKNIELLRQSVLKHSLCEPVIDNPCLDLDQFFEDLPLPDDVKLWFSSWYCTENIDITWVFEPLTLHSPLNYPRNQEQYRWGEIGSRIKDPCWDDNWLLIGDLSLDPVIVDITDGGSSIKMAVHGGGAWDFRTVFPDLSSFFSYCSEWLDWYYEIDDKELWTDADVLNEETKTMIKTIFLRHSKPEYWKDFKEFVAMGVIYYVDT